MLSKRRRSRIFKIPLACVLIISRTEGIGSFRELFTAAAWKVCFQQVSKQC